MPTINDVARSAGVSIATVSRVFNGRPRVSEDTVQRVRNAASRLGFWPHGAARILTTNRTGTLGVLLPDLYGEFYSEVIRGIDHCARKSALGILVSGSHADAETLLSTARSLRGLVDGLIVMAPEDGCAVAMQQIAMNFRTVLLNGRFEVDECDTISIANFEGAYTLVRHLFRLGHRAIAVLKGPASNVDAEERLRGYRTALREEGIEPETALEFQGDFTELSGYEQGERLLKCPRRPSAIFAANDCMAIGFMSALRNDSVRIPEDIAVAGFDDIVIAQYLNPPLTTVHVDAYELGRRAVLRWLELGGESKRNGRQHEVLPTTLVVRGSCGSNQGSRTAMRAGLRR